MFKKDFISPTKRIIFVIINNYYFVSAKKDPEGYTSGFFFMQQLLKLKLLTDASFLLKMRNNGILQYGVQTDHQAAASLGLGLVRFESIKSRGLKAGTLIQTKGAIRLIKFSNICTILNDGVVGEANLMFNRYVECFKRFTCNGPLTWEKVYHQIQHSLVLKNFKQQQYRIEKWKDTEDAYYRIGDRITSEKKRNSILKKVAKCAAALGITTDDWMKRARTKNKQYIVSGKTHMARLLGMSESSGGRILRRMHKLGIITRTVVMQVLGKVSCQAELEELTHSLPECHIHISKKGICRSFLGSIIGLVDNSYPNTIGLEASK